MNRKQLFELVCPGCASSFIVKKVVEQNGDDVEYGIVTCKCGEYPVIAGILVFKKSKYVKHALDYIHANKSHEALLGIIEFGSSFWKRCLVRLFRTEMPLNKVKNVILMKILKFVQPDYVKRKVSLRQATGVWGLWGSYVRKRFDSRSFIAGSLMINNTSDVGRAGNKILDLCSGVGHFVYKFEHTFPDTEVFCCDKNFVNLYFSRLFFSKKAAVICCDANKPLPFGNNFFSMVFNSDSFHYLDNPVGCCSEIFRVLKNGGQILFAHLHNKLAKNVGQGYAKTCDKYKELFEQFNPVLYSEQLILNKFLLFGKTAVSENSVDELNASNAFILVGRK